MADLDLDAIEARAKAASEGPLETSLGMFNEDGDLDAYLRSPGGGYLGGFPTGVEAQNACDIDAWEPQCLPEDEAKAKASRGWANAQLAAHARADVLALVAELRRLRSEQKRDGQLIQSWADKANHLQRRLRALRRDLEEFCGTVQPSRVGVIKRRDAERDRRWVAKQRKVVRR